MLGAINKLVCCVWLERCRSTTRVAAKVATRVLPKGYWILGAVISWYILALSKEVVLGINLRAIKCLVHCVFVVYSKLAGIRCCWSY